MKKRLSSFSFHRNFIFLTLLLFLGSCTSHYKVIDYSSSKVEVNSTIQENPEIQNYITPYKKQLEEEMNRVIGVSDIRLTKQGNQPETLLGNFFTDVLLDAAKSYDSEVSVGFGTKRGLRIELPKGNLTVGHIFELMPFENKLTILELSGKDLKTLAEFVIQTGGQPLSGMKIQAHNTEINHIEVQGKTLDLNKNYKIVTYDYLANGGDNVKGFESPISRKDLDMMVREAIMKYIEKQTQSGKTITSSINGRVTITK